MGISLAELTPDGAKNFSSAVGLEDAVLAGLQQDGADLIKVAGWVADGVGPVCLASCMGGQWTSLG